MKTGRKTNTSVKEKGLTIQAKTENANEGAM